ncbi:MAG: Ig-like domain repeat protein [Acidobacteriaceae bacterium]|nr:Ig-like domain repeat protein [Acidobacteriaceae bacterium]
MTNSLTVSGGGISQAQTANDTTTINPATVTVTVSTNVSGPMIQVDGGAAFTGSHQFTWSVNQAHSLTTSSPQGTGATVYTFTGWSDGTAATTDSITPPATVASYTAMFSTTYTTTVSASTSPITYSSSAQNVILSATVSSPSTLNTGTVTFTVMSNGTPIGPPVTSAPVTNGATSATFTVPANTAAGSYTIQAQYSGASSALVTYSSSSDTSHVLTVNAASQTITFATPAAVTYASGLTVNLAGDATASSGLPVAYTLQSGGTGIGTLTGTTLTVTEAGTFIIQASQPGNANYSAATPVQATLVVNAATQTITFATPPAVTYTSGLTVNLTGDATASSGLPVTYTLQSGGTGQGGITGTTLTVTQAGAFVIQASQPGNANYSAATPVQATLVVNAATQTITFSTPPPATYTTGLTVNLAGAATATSSLPVTYTLQSGGTGIGSLIGTTLTVTQAGTLVIQASQSGNANYSAATPVQATLVVNAASQTVTFSTPQALTYASGLTANLAGDATASSGLPVTYTLQTGGTGLGSIAGATLTVTQAGTFVIQASQSGNANYSAAAPAQATLVVNAASQTITFATPPAVTFTSGLTVNLAGDATPSSGLAVTYTLQAGGTGLGSITGTTLTVTQAGTFVIQASQPGNANYSAATPAQATLVVNRGIQVITFSNPGPQSYGTGPLALSATVNSGLIVNFVSNTTPVCTVAGSTLTIVSVGLCSITASVAANVDYLAASNVAQAFQIQPAPQTITFSTLGNQVVPGFPLALSASASSGLPVSVSSLTPSVCTVTSALPVRAKVLAAGTCSLQATQPGNALYAPATAVQSLTVASHR